LVNTPTGATIGKSDVHAAMKPMYHEAIGTIVQLVKFKYIPQGID